ncbi:MAG TPA: hypothetical protein GX010_00575 [Erysipelotrichaceae bacterium]|nr:hypothetical protein [Erysipelotrichaceae bacterium]
MKTLANNDFLEVRLASMIADYDRDTIANLYQSMIGYEALAVYMTLWSEANNEKVSPLCTHGQVFSRMRMTADTFVMARRYLEAVGLLKTFVLSREGFNIYHYELYAPKSPRGFFDDTLLYGMLIKTVGENNANRLKNIYLVDRKDDYGEEITAQYVEVFHPEFNDQAFIEAINNNSKIKGRNSGKIKSQFQQEEFFNCLSSISQITFSAFKKEELKEIERLATLYGIDEQTSANLVNQIYEPSMKKGERIDFSRLNKMMQEISDSKYSKSKENEDNKPNLNQGQTDLAKKINLMETTSPVDYLTCLQNGIKPASVDMRLLDDLSNEFKLTDAVINALVDYVLTRADNTLARAFCEKIAASLVRENCRTAVDAMNYLKKTDRRGRNDKRKTKTYSVTEDKTPKKSIKKEENENWEVEWERLIEELNGGNGHEKD